MPATTITAVDVDAFIVLLADRLAAFVPPGAIQYALTLPVPGPACS